MLLTPNQSAKNLMLSPAASDLGLGDQLNQQLESELEKRKKDALKQGQMNLLSPATLSLFGQVGGFGG